MCCRYTLSIAETCRLFVMVDRPAVQMCESAEPSLSRKLDRLLTKRELAVFLGLTPRTIELYQRRGLPFYRVGRRRNRYDLLAVRRWLRRETNRLG
jgi:hypothetical protein